MHTGRSYGLFEFLDWTRRNVYVLVLVGALAVILYEVFDLKWLGIPWTVVALLGTATAFIVGFRNIQTYNRTWEARQIWSEIVGASRAWGTMSRDYLNNSAESRELIYRHLAWLTALRFQLREPRSWETTARTHNAEYGRFYTVPERETTLEAELQRYVTDSELKQILTTTNRATQIGGLQSKAIAKLFAKQAIVVLQLVDMQRTIKDLFLQQSKSERIKEFPYPRQFATVSKLFVKVFCLLLPFGLLREFDKLNDGMEGVLSGNMTWLVIPFSVVISWVFTSLDQVGESTENPFEGNANDVPITQICRKIEVDLREMLGETDLPPLLHPANNIVL
jgi:putative membrane protein